MTWYNFLGLLIVAWLTATTAIPSLRRRNHKPVRAQAVEDEPAVEVGWSPEHSVFDDPARFGYSIFTDRHDRVIEAAELKSEIGAQERRKLLDGIIESNSRATSHLCDLLRERGAGSSLAACVLVDHSGSMRIKIGEAPLSINDTVVRADSPAASAAGLAISIASALQGCGASVEVLGFTTVEWRGGQSRKDWLASGKPPRPGRLNDLLHIIYKRMDEGSTCDWSSRLEILLDPSNLKENFDGEAIAWARSRLLAQPAAEHLLIVLSDGAPVDDSTLMQNGPNYLMRHLLNVIDDINRRGDLRIIGFGIECDISLYLPRSIIIKDAAFEQDLPAIADLISESTEKVGLPLKDP